MTVSAEMATLLKIHVATLLKSTKSRNSKTKIPNALGSIYVYI